MLRMADSYYRRLASRTWKETKHVWTIHRWWLTIAPPFTSLLLLGARRGWSGIMNAQDVLLNAFCLAAVAFIGTLAFSLIHSTKLLDDDRAAMISTLQIPDLEESKRSVVRAKLNQAPQQYREPLESVLRHMLHFGMADRQAPLATSDSQHSFDTDRIRYTTEYAIGAGLIVVTAHRRIEINPELKDTLVFILGERR